MRRVPDGCEVVWLDLLTADRVEQLLSPEEQARARDFRRSEDRASFVTTRAKLRELIGRKLGVPPADVAFVAGEHGKPQLPRHELHFSVAHCEGHAIVALREQGPVGVDVEPLTATLRERDAIARRVLSSRERQWLSDRPEATKTRDFVRLWVLKEAFAKCIGFGLSGPLHELEADMGDDGPRGVRWLGHPERSFVAVELARDEGVAAALVTETTASERSGV